MDVYTPISFNPIHIKLESKEDYNHIMDILSHIVVEEPSTLSQETIQQASTLISMLREKVDYDINYNE